MIPPFSCIYSGLTAAPCWNCYNYIPDTDDCKLKYLAISTSGHTENNNNSIAAPSYEEQMRRYNADRKKLLELSKESLVDMILHKPTLL